MEVLFNVQKKNKKKWLTQKKSEKHFTEGKKKFGKQGKLFKEMESPVS